MRHVRFAAGTAFALLLASAQWGEVSAQMPESISTPDSVDTRIGTLKFNNGAPSEDTVDKVYDNLDFTYAFRAFMDNMRGVSIAALKKGMMDIGVK
ncbi:MAG: DUF1254 domain-containing protein, partial [Bauldia litoralis]